MSPQISPLPSSIGIGFTTFEPKDFEGYRHEITGRYHNYFFTPEAWEWPYPTYASHHVIDGFSPNLNKDLHCGHLKNLAVAAALSQIIGEGTAVAMLGASQGIKPGTLEKYKEWCDLANYRPTIYFDTELPKVHPERLIPGEGEYSGCLMLKDAPNPTVVYKSDGSPTYAAHDLAFAQTIAPDYYLTGAEQKEHFKNLGLGDKHISLGLLLGKDGRKMRSTIKKEGQEANALSAEELFALVLTNLRPGKNQRELAWNILAWQFNSSAIPSNTKFDATTWSKPESPGLYITYTYARVHKALQDILIPESPKDVEITQKEVPLLGLTSYFNHYLEKAETLLAPCEIAQYSLKLARELGNLYHNGEVIKNCTPAYAFALNRANQTLAQCMHLLSMHSLQEV
jgi:arginyl-tRNA synthetase